jgi:glycosyltransferase involved in cell wall biosynthesis
VGEPTEGAGQRPRERFRVVNIFHFGSSFERKNPLGLVQAFRGAFGDDPGAELVLKTSYGDRHGDEKARLIAAVNGAGNIRLIDEVWGEDRIGALVRSADVYASLHRSEGFGLPLAEAMMAETPVIATNWSGNIDFCPSEQIYPVDYDLVPFRDDHPDYAQVADARWAEPVIAHASQQLRRVRADGETARHRARAAKHSLRAYLASTGYEQALQLLFDPREASQPPDRALSQSA